MVAYFKNLEDVDLEVDEMLNYLNLYDEKDTKAKDLSGGFKRRL